MAISRCNGCGLITEHEPEAVGTKVTCSRCAADTPVYETVFFLTKVFEQFFAQRSELAKLRETVNQQRSGVAVESPAKAAAPAGGQIDLHDSDHFSSPEQHRAIVEWFRAKGMAVTIDHSAVDTSGFFDEAAVALGSDFSLLGEVLERIRFAQAKEYNSALIHLERKSEEDAAAIVAFGKQLYRYSLVARCFVNKAEKTMRLVLQNAPSVRKFFAGAWLEWFALMVALRVSTDRKTGFSCARNLTITIGANENREVDVVLLPSGAAPIIIECKSGEFRQDIDKYVSLRKRLSLGSDRFIVCVADLEAEQAKGMGAMYGLSFVNTESLGPHLASVL